MRLNGIHRSWSGILLVTLALASCRSKAPEQAAPLEVFDTQVAMRTMFGNFDPVTKSSLSQVPAGASTNDGNFAQKDEIRSRPFFVQEVNENGARKVYMLAWAKPAGQPFDCKGCAPLISAAVFVRGADGWKPESLSRAVVAFGDFGKPPEASLVEIGPQAHAFLIRVTSAVERTTTGEAILVPWKGSVTEALRTIVADTNKGNCGGAYPCYGNERELKFVPGPNQQYSDIALTLSGTDMLDHPPYKTHPVSGSELRRFKDGKYEIVERQGDSIAAEVQKPR